jgi:hypothetical protein
MVETFKWLILDKGGEEGRKEEDRRRWEMEWERWERERERERWEIVRERWEIVQDGLEMERERWKIERERREMVRERWEMERERWERERERWEEKRAARLFLLMILQWICFLMRQTSFAVSFSQRVPWAKKRMKSVSASMPWTIAPALLVLWSVVWMFYDLFMGYPVPRDGER